MHLKRVVGQAKLTFEELTTVLAQIEACLNSRPLTPLPDVDDGYEVLTPTAFRGLARPRMFLSAVVGVASLAPLPDTCAALLDALVFRVRTHP